MPTEILEHLLNTDAVIINYAEGPPSGPPLVLHVKTKPLFLEVSGQDPVQFLNRHLVATAHLTSRGIGDDL